MIPRRLLLGAPAALAAPIVPASAGAVPSPDAELIRACTRYLELERAMNDPMHPDHAKDCDELPEWPEYCAVQDALLAAQARTPEGIAALAYTALLSGAGREQTWMTNDAVRIARKLLVLLAGPGLTEAEAREEEEERRRSAIIAARYAAQAVAS